MNVEARITGKNVAVVVKSIEALPEAVSKASAIGLQRALFIVAGRAQKNYMSGPRPQKLGQLSGRLKGGVTTAVETRAVGSVIGKIGDNVEYAAYHEFGFHGTVNVSSYTRVLENIGEFGDDQDHRRHWRDRDGNFLGYRDNRKQASGRFKHFADTVQFIRAGTRNIDYDGRPYIRPAIQDSLPDIAREVNKELKAIQPGTANA